MSRSAEAAFAQFVATGAPGDLAEVFDATAPELLRVAWHLAPRGVEPEDLVQETFLAAIEHRRRFREGERVLPWLLGILANHGRRAQRTTRPDPARLSRPSIPDPSRGAEQRELEAALERALIELPETYRQVLVLHLRHGLQAKEIAAALGRPAGTVRTQIVRGMDRLRQGLPAGVAGAAVLVEGSGRGLDAVRDELLASLRPTLAAAGTATAVGAAAVASTASMKKVTLLGLAALVLGLVYGFGPSPFGGDDLPALPDEPAPQSARIDVESTPPGDTGAPSREAAFTEGVGARGLTVTVLHADGSPAQGVEVHRVNGPNMIWRVEERQLVNAAGTVHFAGAHGVVHLRTDRGTRVTEVVVADAPGSAELRLARGMSVHGRVVDERGLAVAGAEVRIWSSDVPEAEGRVLATSDAEGSFRIVDMEVDNLQLWACRDGYARSPILDLYGAEGSDREVELRLRSSPACLSGVLLDRAGRAAPDAPLYLILRDARSLGEGIQDVVARTDAAGRFALPDLPAGSWELFAGHRQSGLVRRALHLESGVELRLELAPEPGALVRGQVRDARGAGHGDLFVIANWEGPLLGPRSEVKLGFWGDSGRDGNFAVEGLLPGPYRFQVGTNSRRTTQVVTLAAGEVLEWNPEVERSLRQSLRLVYPDGSPLEDGWGLTYVRWLGPSSPGKPRPADVLASGWVREGGVIQFGDLRGTRGDLLLRAPRGRRGMYDAMVPFPIHRIPDLVLDGEPKELVVPDNLPEPGRVEGRLVDDAGEAVLGVVLQLTEPEHYTRAEVKSGPDGRFELNHLPPGSYELSGYRNNESPMERFARFTLTAGEALDLGAVDLPALAEVVVEISGPDGEPPADLTVRTRSVDNPLYGHELEPREPGRYLLVCRPEPIDLEVFGAGVLPVHQSLRPVAGTQLPLQISLQSVPSCRFELHLPGPPGGKALGHYVVRDALGQMVFRETFFGALEGERILVFERGLAPGRYELELFQGDQELRHRFTVDGSARTVVVGS